MEPRGIVLGRWPAPGCLQVHRPAASLELKKLYCTARTTRTTQVCVTGMSPLVLFWGCFACGTVRSEENQSAHFFYSWSCGRSSAMTQQSSSTAGRSSGGGCAVTAMRAAARTAPVLWATTAGRPAPTTSWMVRSLCFNGAEKC